MEEYQQVSCALHSAIELAVMQRERLIVRTQDGRTLEGEGEDVVTREGGEYLLLALVGGGQEVLRLDRLKEIRLARTGEHLA